MWSQLISCRVEFEIIYVFFGYPLISTISWYFMIFHDISWYFMIFHDISWYFMIFHDISWYFMIFHDISWYFMIHDWGTSIFRYLLTWARAWTAHRKAFQWREPSTEPPQGAAACPGADGIWHTTSPSHRNTSKEIWQGETWSDFLFHINFERFLAKQHNERWWESVEIIGTVGMNSPTEAWFWRSVMASQSDQSDQSDQSPSPICVIWDEKIWFQWPLRWEKSRHKKIPPLQIRDFSQKHV